MAGTSSALSVVGSPLGYALKFNGNVGMQWNGHSTLGNKFKFGGSIDTMPILIHACFRYAHKTTAGHTMNLFQSDVPTVGEPHGYHLHLDANADSLTFEVYDGTSGSPTAMKWQSPSSYLTPGKWHTIVVFMFAPLADDIELGQWTIFWLDGAMSLPGETITRSAIAFSNALHSRIGGRQGGLDPDMQVSLVSIWNRIPAWKEIDLLKSDPLAMFRRSEILGISKAARRVSIGGVTLKRMNAVLAG